MNHMVDNNVQLGKWAVTQRQTRSKMEETEWVRSRLKRLNAINFVWNARVYEGKQGKQNDNRNDALNTGGFDYVATT